MQIDPMEEQAAAAAVVVGGAGAGVRVVARICPLDPAATTGSSFQVAAVRRHHQRDPDSSFSSALVSFVPREDHRSTAASASATGRAATPRKEGGGHKYKLDWCYLQDEPNHHVFHNEVRPLIHHGLSSSSNACVVACSGATANALLFTGSQDQPGLLTMAMAQILDFSKAIGGAVRVSSYQVLQDNHIFDLLEPKDHEVLILEDADGTTHLKGLSRVDVRSIEEFAQLCCCASNQQKHPTKAPSQLQSRGHQGLIVYVSRFDMQGRECAVSKMNFLNLQGYVDPKRKNNGGGLALPNSNKSMYALMNVVQALNSNQSFVPYRQSKVTRILQDSLRKTSGAVLIACLGEVSCQDAVSTVSLASRSSRMVNEQCYSLSMSAKSSLKANENLCMNAENSSMSFLHSISQTNSVLEKHYRPQFSSSTAKASRTPIANKRSHPIMHSAKKPGCSLSTSIKMKQKDTNPTMSGRKLFSPSTNSSKEDAIVVASTAVKKAEEVQPSLGMEIQAPSTGEGCDETGNVVDTVSSEMQEVVPCSMQKLVSSIMQEEDYSSSDLHVEHSCTDLGETCSSNVPDNLAEHTPVSTTQPSSKLSDQLREISNSLKLLSTRPVSITAQKLDMECVREINTDAPEPKTPAVHLKFGQGEDPNDILKARSTGIKKSLVQECLTFLNSANKEQLKSLKGIGEKRANYILELREESPELFKEIDDLRDIIGMNSKEIKKMMSGIIDS